jgi:hypothetical protein
LTEKIDEKQILIIRGSKARTGWKSATFLALWTNNLCDNYTPTKKRKNRKNNNSSSPFKRGRGYNACWA